MNDRKDLKNASIEAIDHPWGFRVKYTVCERCKWRFLSSEETPLQRCPHCSTSYLLEYQLSPEFDSENIGPELIIAHSVDRGKLAEEINTFIKGIPFAPQDLTTTNLGARLQRIYSPVWLVDVEVRSKWGAQIGFNYQVVSHQDRYDQQGRGWTSQEVKENRIRWEPRLGNLARSYQNVKAPAIEIQYDLTRQLGDFDLKAMQEYQPELLKDGYLRLPERVHSDAWIEAVASLQALAAADCQRAAGGDHLRQFQWEPQFIQQTWSLLLLPIYISYYVDDDQNPLPVTIHGQSGRVHGSRKASMKRAQRASRMILLIAAVIFLLGLLLAAVGAVLPPLLAAGGLVIFLSVFVAMGSLAPLVVVWQTNKTNQSS